MGFKAKRLGFMYGSANFPTGSSGADVLQREKCIVGTVAQTLIDFGIGWQIDTSKCTDITDFKTLPDAYYQAGRETALYLKNAISGCKLLVGYIIGTPAKGLDVSSDFYVNTYNSSYATQNGSVAGLIFSVIPGNSSDVFGTTSQDLIPASATRVTGTVTTSYSSSNTLVTMGSYNGPSGTTLYYVILATDSVVGTLIYDTYGHLWPRCFAGKIFSSTVNDSSLYGTVSFKVIKTITEFEQDSPNSTYSTFRYGNVNSYSQSIDFSNKSYYICGGNSLRTVNGDWISNTSNTGCCLYSNFWMTTATIIHADYTTAKRWEPFYMFVLTNDLTTYGVIPGDGVKGVLDTDLFRSIPSPGSAISYYDNKNFAALAEGLMLGWDPTNEDIPGSV